MNRNHIYWTPTQRIDRWFRRSVVQDGECWIWTGAKTRNGYGQVGVNRKHLMAHRAVYEYFIGTPPHGLDLDHLCRNRACVNPYHLEPVTRSVNLKRGAYRTHNTSKTHCPQGHPYDYENTYVTKLGGRSCRACARHRERAKRAARKERNASD